VPLTFALAMFSVVDLATRCVGLEIRGAVRAEGRMVLMIVVGLAIG
jgi:hypothetical protein